MTSDRMDSTATPRTGSYDLDLANSTIEFTTKHLFGLLPVRGTFTLCGGAAEITDPISGSGVEAEIDAASFRTSTDQRDKVIRSSMYLDTAKYPTITFSSTKWDGERLTGMLTVCGTTKPVSLLVEESSVAEDAFTARATARIDRTDFGVTAARGMTGRYLDFTLTVHFARR